METAIHSDVWCGDDHLGHFECSWSSSGVLFVKALLFPLELLAGTFFTYDNIINILFYWGVMIAVQVGVYRAGLRAAVLIWIALLLH